MSQCLIDDVTLERLLGDAADAIAVPADGPERVLATRGAVAPLRRSEPRGTAWVRRRPLRAAAAVIASIVAIGLVAGVVSGSGGSAPSESASHAAILGPSAPAAPSGAQSAAGARAASGAVPARGAAGGLAAGTTQTTPDLVPSESQAKVVKTGSMTLRVVSVESTLDRLTVLAGNAGGYVASTTANIPGDGQTSTGDITLRVPEAAFESVVSQARALGKPARVTISGQDVTAQYADLKARLLALQSTISQLQLIETKAQTIGDVLAVEQQISAQQTQADQIQGQINVLDDEATYASLSVHVVGQQKKAAIAPPPPSGISRAWDHARHSFAHGVEAVIGALGGIAVFLLFAGILLVIARVGWLALRRRLV